MTGLSRNVRPRYERINGIAPDPVLLTSEYDARVTERVIKLTVEYDGTAYVGWQVQPNGPSIQSKLEEALAALVGEPTRVTGAGRTDAGVHARAQVASFRTPRDLPLKAFVAGMNGLLPRDIAVIHAEECRPDFDARRSARGKIYRYRIVNRPTRAPLSARYAWEVFRPLDLAPMQRAALSLVGEHDFSAFRAADCPAENPVREVRRLEVLPGPDGLAIEVEATAFLKHMVRNFVGTLVEVGAGARDPEDPGRVLAGRDRTRAGPTAPPQGLCLMRVLYVDGHALGGYP